jgi:transcriptional regulator of acetoin/glycerol metabolism
LNVISEFGWKLAPAVTRQMRSEVRYMTQTRQLVIVRRNQLATFAMLAHAFADEPGVRFIWDRRLRERRQAPTSLDPEERRRRDRRRDPWTTWEGTDYLLLGVTEASSAPTETIARPDADGDEPAHEDIRRDIEAAVRSDFTVLISGGDPISRKSLAHQIHRRSDRGGRPLFVMKSDAFIEFFETLDINVPFPSLVVGARTRHAPRANGIEGGTLLIEEVADLSWEEQSKLLLFLEHATQRNHSQPRGVRDARIMSGTGHQLLNRVASKQFRADLFYRLNTIHLVLPQHR